MSNEQNEHDVLDRHISDKELSELVGIAVPTLQSWRSRGQGPEYVKVGGRIRYNVRKVKEYLENRTRNRDAKGPKPYNKQAA